MNTRKSFPFAPSSVSQARHFAATILESIPDTTIEPLLLIVSELATNAIRHAHTGFTVEIELSDNEVRISVTDNGTGRPEVKSPLPTQPSGRGLKFVDLLSNQWGVIPSTTKSVETVWFTMSVTAQKGSFQSAC